MKVSSDNQARLKDIARRAGVSAVAAGRVLLGSGSGSVRVSIETAQRIRQIAQELNYAPNMVAQQLAGKKSQVIGVIIDSNTPSVYFDLLPEMERQAGERKYRMMIGLTHRRIDLLREYAVDFSRRGADGLICASQFYPDRDQIQTVEELLFSHFDKVVFINTPSFTNPRLCFVDTDRADGIRQAVEYLVGKGRRRIGFILPNLDSVSMRERERGYRQTLQKHGIPIDPEWLHLLGTTGPVTEEPMTAATQHLVQTAGVNAILAQNDLAAVYIIKACKRLRYRVPEDIAVVGFDNALISSLVEPSITTIDQHFPDRARLTVNMIIDLIEGKDLDVPARQIVVRPDLVVRESA